MFTTKPKIPSKKITVPVESAPFELETSTSSGNATIVLITGSIREPEWITEIIDGIEGLTLKAESVFLDGLDEYEVLLNFNLEEMQRKFDLLISGQKMQDLVELGERCGVVYLDDEFDINTLPKDKLYIQIKRDEHSMPLSLYVRMANFYHTKSITVDLLDIAKKSMMVKNNKLSYYLHIKEIESDFKKIAKDIKHSSKEFHSDIVADFNKKWVGDIVVTLTYDATLEYIDMQAKDNWGEHVGMATFLYRSPSERHRFFSKARHESNAVSNTYNTSVPDTSSEISIFLEPLSIK